VKKYIATIVTAFIALALALPAAADVTKLKPARGVKFDYKTVEHVTVATFSDATKKKPKDPADREKHAAAVAAAAQQLADGIIERLRAADQFDNVSGGSSATDGIVITGRITDYRDSNLGMRYIGLGAGARFGAEMEVHDASGKLLGKAKGIYAGSFIPGAINFAMTSNRFIGGIGSRFADEILIAKGAMFREETGRSGRLREQYKSGN
jgi:hypothetical protein